MRARRCEVSARMPQRLAGQHVSRVVTTLAIKAVVLECWRSGGAWRALCCASSHIKEPIDTYSTC